MIPQIVVINLCNFTYKCINTSLKYQTKCTILMDEVQAIYEKLRNTPMKDIDRLRIAKTMLSQVSEHADLAGHISSEFIDMLYEGHRDLSQLLRLQTENNQKHEECRA